MNSPIQLDDDSVGEQSRAGPSRYKEIIAIPSSDPPSEDLPDLYSGVRYDRLPTPEPELEPTPLSSPQRTSARKRAHDVTGHGDEPERPIDPEPKRIRNKGKSKSTDLVEKQLENARKAAEKEYNRRFKEANKLRTSKSEALKEIKTYLSPNLRSNPSFSPILPALKEKFESLSSTVLPLESALLEDHPGLICFKRFVNAGWNESRRSWEPLSQEEEGWMDEGLVLFYLEAKDFIGLIKENKLPGWIKTIRTFISSNHPPSPSLPRNLNPPTYPRKKDGLPQVMLLIHGLKEYYKSTARSRSAGKITKLMVDKELLRIWMEWGWFQVEVESHEALEVWMYNIAADLAIRPYRLIQKSHAHAIIRETTQKGSSKQHTLELMLQEIPGVTPSGAIGIAHKYKSFAGLMSEFKRVEREEGKERARGMVADCQVKQLKNGVQNERKIGLAVSRHIWNAFREPNPLANV